MNIYQITHTNRVKADSIQGAVNEYKRLLSTCNQDYPMNNGIRGGDYFDAGLVRVEQVSFDVRTSNPDLPHVCSECKEPCPGASFCAKYEAWCRDQIGRRR